MNVHIDYAYMAVSLIWSLCYVTEVADIRREAQSVHRSYTPAKNRKCGGCFTGNTDDPEPRSKHRVVCVRDIIDKNSDNLDLFSLAVLEYGK